MSAPEWIDERTAREVEKAEFEWKTFPANPSQPVAVRHIGDVEIRLQFMYLAEEHRFNTVGYRVIYDGGETYSTHSRRTNHTTDVIENALQAAASHLKLSDL